MIPDLKKQSVKQRNHSFCIVVLASKSSTGFHKEKTSEPAIPQ